jgi:phosphohistidine phosphatase
MKTKRLFLIRHAKSSWSNASLSDFDRPLNDRGKRACTLMSTYFHKNGWTIDQLLTSPAARTLETLDLLRCGQVPIHRISELQELYLAPASTILAAIQSNGLAESNDLAVLGHNPGLEALASMLSGKLTIMPTLAIAKFEWSVNSSDPSWHDLTNATLTYETSLETCSRSISQPSFVLVTPRELDPELNDG